MIMQVKGCTSVSGVHTGDGEFFVHLLLTHLHDIQSL